MVKMPFHGTPESLLARADSKNPLHTCRGLTSNGRPCRRGISQTPGLSPSPMSSPGKVEGDVTDGFCWQHREQAPPQQSPSPARRKGRPEVIRERSSVDSLVEKLGILEIEKGKRRRKAVPLPDPDVPIPSIEHDSELDSVKLKSRSSKKKQSKSNSSGSSWCCFGETDDYSRAPRPRPTNPKMNLRTNTTVSLPMGRSGKSSHHLHPGHDSRPQLHRDPSSRTGEFLALIPPTASPTLTAQLLAELAKPFSEHDDHGYIYMFWLTPESLPADTPLQTASTLLAPPPTNQSRHQRRTSDVLSSFSSTTPSNPKKTMLLKIGRAQNVHRRLNQWTRQCGYNLSLIRFYPYHPTSTGSSSYSTPTLASGGNDAPNTPRKVPNAHKIERLIHIELGDKRVKGEGKCDNCGREHREWFEVDAHREGVKAVDDIIRRWVDWGERQA